jgi:hypothetical protein
MYIYECNSTSVHIYENEWVQCSTTVGIGDTLWTLGFLRRPTRNGGTGTSSVAPRPHPTWQPSVNPLECLSEIRPIKKQTAVTTVSLSTRTNNPSNNSPPSLIHNMYELWNSVHWIAKWAGCRHKTRYRTWPILHQSVVQAWFQWGSFYDWGDPTKTKMVVIDGVDDNNHENTPPVRFSALVLTLLRYLQDAILYRDN